MAAVSKGNVVVITGGTGGIGFQAALALAKANANNTIIITGRNSATGTTAVEQLKASSSNSNVHLALADMSKQSAVRALAADLLQRFPVIDVLINNAGNLCLGELEMIEEGGGSLTKNFAVNVMGPLLLTRLLVPALSAAQPVGNVQITSGGMPFPALKLKDIEGKMEGAGLPSYSHSKRVMETMALALEKELKPSGIAVNVVGGGNPGATAMTSNVSMSDLPRAFRCCFPCFKNMMKPDKGESAAKCAAPVVWAVSAAPHELGTGNIYMTAPNKKTAWPKAALDISNQTAVLAYCDSKLIK
mmetsp:Transcript_56558/g.91543  ORF Transcript_56558/g.91543 Transcript_56558/m.91543 type:complete len:302 (-) Transcript_56558:456-1361(-)